MSLNTAFHRPHYLKEAQRNDAVIVGVSGSRHGPTPHQRRALATLLRLWKADIVIHGDCVGVDAYAHQLAKALGMESGAYPGNIERFRAHTEKKGAALVEEPMHPLARNELIALACDVLVAFPMPDSRGTYHAIKMADRHRTPCIVVDGLGHIKGSQP